MDYSGINAKVKAMKGRLLDYSDYYELASLKSVESVGMKLRENVAYTEFMDSVLAQADHSRHIFEQKLLIIPVNDYYKIYRFIPDFNIKRYLKTLALKKEMLLIKLIFCSLYDERNITYSKDELEYISKFDLNFDVTKLIVSKNARELIDNLKGTEFYDILDGIYTEGISIFDLEMSLDFYYYNRLWRDKNKYLKGRNKSIMTDITGTEIDMQNIIWIYRLKKYYQIKSNDIFKYLIPIHYRLSGDSISKLVEAPNMNILYDYILNTPYGYAFKDESDLTRCYNNVMYKAYERYMTQQNSIAQITDFLHRKQIETENIISLIEGVRYSLSPDEIMKYLHLASV
ncbi:MAG: hypothetical protein E7234_06455 [Lachnospiraceae bacterium]|nr:hypothetical protein [Lachnospiraceae bacterium]